MGTHRQLLQECEVYRQIAESQLSEEELRFDCSAGEKEKKSVPGKKQNLPERAEEGKEETSDGRRK